MKKLLVAIVMTATLVMTPGRVSANTIEPFLISVAPDGSGNFDWTWGFTITANTTVRSVATLCGLGLATPADCAAPPVTGSAMFNFYDYFGAVDFFGGLLGDGSDIDVSGLPHGAFDPDGPDDIPNNGDDDPLGWFSLIYPEGDNIVGPELAVGQDCGFVGDCPPDDGTPNVLFAYVGGPDYGFLGTALGSYVGTITLQPSGAVVGPVTFTNFLGSVVIKSVYGEISPTQETWASFDWSGTQTVPQTHYSTYFPPQVPEPTSLILLGTGLLGIGSRLRKKNKKDSPTV